MKLDSLTLNIYMYTLGGTTEDSFTEVVSPTSPMMYMSSSSLGKDIGGDDINDHMSSK